MRGSLCFAACVTASALVAGEIPYVGLRFAPVGPELAAYLGLSGGVRVRAVDPGSPGEGAGIKTHDIVLAWGGKQVSGVEELKREVRASAIGSPMQVTVLRRGSEVEVTITATASDRAPVSPPMAKTLGRLKDNLTITYYVSKELPPSASDLRDETLDFLYELALAAPARRLQVKVSDPAEEVQRAARDRERLKQKAATSPGEEDVARESEPIAGVTKPKRRDYEKVLEDSGRQGIREIVLREVKGDRVEVARFYSALRVSYRGKESELIAEHRSLDNLEYELASRVLKLTMPEGAKPVLAFFNGQAKKDGAPPIPGMGFPPERQEGDEYRVFKTQVFEQVFNVAETRIAGDDQIPEGTKVLILVQPKDLSERQVCEINRFVSSGGKAVVLVGTYTVDLRSSGRVDRVTTGLESLLAAWGVRFDARPLNSGQCGRIVGPMATKVGPFVMRTPVSVPAHVLATRRDFAADAPVLCGIDAIVAPWSVALRVDSPEELQKKGISAQVLVTSSERSWFGNSSPVSMKDVMANGPGEKERDSFKWAGRQNLIVLLRGTFPFLGEGKELPSWTQTEGQAATGERAHLEAPKESAVLVVGSPDLVKDEYLEHSRELYLGNFILLRNVIESFMLGDELLDLKPRKSAREGR